MPTGKTTFSPPKNQCFLPAQGTVKQKACDLVDFDTKTQLKKYVKRGGGWWGPKGDNLSSSPSNSFRSPDGSIRENLIRNYQNVHFLKPSLWGLTPENCRLESENQPVGKEYHHLQTFILGRSMLSCSDRAFWDFCRMIYHSISAHLLEYKHRALAARYASGIFHYQVSSYTYPRRWLHSTWSSTYIPGKSTSETRKWFGLHHTPLEGHQHLKMLGHLIHVNLRGPPRTACHPPSRHKAPGMATGQTLSFSW